MSLEGKSAGEAGTGGGLVFNPLMEVPEGTEPVPPGQPWVPTATVLKVLGLLIKVAIK